MKTTTAKQADHYIVEWTYWAKPKREEFDSLNDAMEKVQELTVPGLMVYLIVAFTDGTQRRERVV